MATHGTEGRREIEAAKQRLSAAKSHDNFISKTLVSATAAEETAKKMLATAKKNREDIEAQAKSSNKEVSDAKQFLVEVEKRWEVIAIDIDDDMSTKKNDKERCKKLLVSVTGYQGANRYTIRSMVNEIGADWSDNLSRRNTHLVCEKAEGQKYTKALEWGIHVVSIEWLRRIVKYGYEEGSEDKLSLNNTQQQTDTKESGKKRKAAAVSPQGKKNSSDNNAEKEDSQYFESDAAVLNGYPSIKDVESWNRIYVAADR